MSYTRLLSALLRTVGTVEILAFVAVVMPREWMVNAHAWLGLGEFPRLGVIDFMIRQASYMYGIHGVLLWTLSLDVHRYRPLVLLTGFSYLLAGPIFLWIEVSSDMPLFWTVFDPIACAGFGAAVLWLSYRCYRSTRRAEHR